MNTGDKIDLALANDPKKKLTATVLKKTAAHALLTFTDPPEWYQMQERCQGMFFGTAVERRLEFFHDHTGTWTSIQDMKQYTITPAP